MTGNDHPRVRYRVKCKECNHARAYRHRDMAMSFKLNHEHKTNHECYIIDKKEDAN